MSQQNLLDQMRKALILQRDGKPARARPIYERILKQDPANAEAINLLALCFLETGFPKRAADLLARAIALAPGESRYCVNLADCRERMEDAEGALAVLDEGLARMPGDPPLLQARASLLRRMERYPEAIAAFDLAVRAAPENADLLAEYGQALLLAEQHADAEKLFRFVLQGDPQHRIALFGLVDVLNHLVRTEEALELLAAFAQQVDTAKDAEYQLHLANTLWGSGAFNEALAALDVVEALGHRSPETFLLRGKALFHLGRFAEARPQLEASLALDPAGHDAAMTLGFCFLALGELAKGWALTERRFDFNSRGIIRRRFAAPAWRGEPIADRTLLVWHDQGIGDVLRAATMFRELATKCRRLIVECHEKLVPFLSRNFPEIEVRPSRQDAMNALMGGGNDFDVQCSIGTLPAFLRPTIESFPKLPDRLVADGIRTDRLRARPPLDGRKPLVGLSWTSGNRTGLRSRSYLVLADLLPILTIPDVEFVLLDYTDRSEEIAELRREHDFSLHHWDDLDLFDDMETVAALTSCMDLVVSANTSVADMTGALGVPCLRFGTVNTGILLGEENPPWYPSTRYYKIPAGQPAVEVVPRLAEDFKAWLAAFGRQG